MKHGLPFCQKNIKLQVREKLISHTHGTKRKEDTCYVHFQTQMNEVSNGFHGVEAFTQQNKTGHVPSAVP